LVGLSGSEPEAIAIHRTSGGIPELDEVLWCHEDRFTLSAQRIEGGLYERIERVVRLDPSQQDVCVDEI